jgi:ligand-binding sensor domain-containing protein/serine phosphatase RsbU (regulator of sigma subunit)
MKIKFLRFLVSVLLILVCKFASAQKYYFRNFTPDDGLSQQYIYKISQANNGFLQFSTSDGFLSYNGLNFTTKRTNYGLIENFVNTHFTAKDKKTWLGYMQGGISYSIDSSFVKIENKLFDNTKIIKISEDQSGVILVATSNNELIAINKNFDVTKLDINLESINDFFLNDDNLLIASNNGLHIFSYSATNNFPQINPEQDPELTADLTIRNIQYYKNGIIALGLENEGLMLIKKINGYYKKLLNLKEINSDNYSVNEIKCDPNANLIWYSVYGDGVRRLIFSSSGVDSYSLETFKQENGLCGNYITTIFKDGEGVYWFGSFGNGLSQLVNETFLSFVNSADKGNNVLAITVDHKSTIWLGTSDGLFAYENGKRFTTPLLDKEISSLFCFAKKLWIGTNYNGIYCYSIDEKKMEHFDTQHNLTAKAIHTITSNDKNEVFFGTENGLYIYNLEEKKFTHLTTNEGLIHNVITNLFYDAKGRLWFAAFGSGLFYYYEGEFVLFKDIPGVKSYAINSITEDKNNIIWFATGGDGLFSFHNNTFNKYSIENGLGSNYCYLVFCDKDNKIWVGHKNGLSSISPDKTIHFYNKKNGVVEESFNLNSVCKGLSNYYYLGTNNGFLSYAESKNQRNSIEPILSFESILVNGLPQIINESIDLPYKKYSVKFNFIGVSLSEPQKVTYKYMLKGYDNEWMNAPFNIHSATYSKLEPGKYEFLLLARNSKGIWNKKPLSIKISIAEPFWKNPWLQLLCLICLIVFVYFLFRLRIRALRIKNSQLENLIHQRTIQLSNRNFELEQTKLELQDKNKDIIDSINYAQLIQKSFLSKRREVYQSFPNSFVFFKPKDNIGGDFYFYLKDDTTIYISVADCTGHGVPGALLTLVGHERLLDAIRLFKQTSEILKRLNQGVKISLGQDENSTSRDGMDIALCAIDLNTLQVQYSGANRPFWLIRKGQNEIDEIKATKVAIGGSTPNDQEFAQHNLQLNEGDTIYLFSDGYADTFDSMNKKRIKSSRFKELLLQIQDKSMYEQETEIVNYFNAWRGENKQTDDILVLGIKL